MLSYGGESDGAESSPDRVHNGGLERSYNESPPGTQYIKQNTISTPRLVHKSRHGLVVGQESMDDLVCHEHDDNNSKLDIDDLRKTPKDKNNEQLDDSNEEAAHAKKV